MTDAELERQRRDYVLRQIEQRLTHIEAEYKNPNWAQRYLINEVEAYMKCALDAGIITHKAWKELNARALEIRYFFE
jgi:leucyl aminopeptidase (aminopeptidase T)